MKRVDTRTNCRNTPAPASFLEENKGSKLTLEYRERLYERYAALLGKGGGEQAYSVRQGNTWLKYVDGWLPQSKQAAILDAGCGSGRTLDILGHAGYENLHGVDISKDQIVLARKIAPDVDQGDVLEYLEARPESFDLILAIDIVEHLTKDEALSFADGCFASLRPGGRLIVQTPNGSSPFVGANLWGDLSHETCFTPATLTQLLQMCGFTDIEAREQGPVPHGLLSGVRWFLWKLLRLGQLARNVVETGSKGSGVFTRVFVAAGRKPSTASGPPTSERKSIL